jgi:hypothetical protein
MARRDQKIPVFFTPDELNAVTKHCQEMHLSLSDWLRTLAFKDINKNTISD